MCRLHSRTQLPEMEKGYLPVIEDAVFGGMGICTLSMAFPVGIPFPNTLLHGLISLSYENL